MHDQNLKAKRERIENTTYKVVRYEIKRPAEYIKKRLVESRIEYEL